MFNQAKFTAVGRVSYPEKTVETGSPNGWCTGLQVFAGVFLKVVELVLDAEAFAPDRASKTAIGTSFQKKLPQFSNQRASKTFSIPS